jgi:hypothetical protein
LLKRVPSFYANAVTLATRLALAFVMAWPLLATGVSAGDPELSSGVKKVEEGDFEGALVTLEPVARRLASAGGPDAVQAFLYLGIAQLALDQDDAARRSFGRALDFDPGLELSPREFSPKVRGALEAARQERASSTVAGEGKATGQNGGGSRKALLLAAAGVAAGVGIAVAATGDSSPGAEGEVRFGGARFFPAAVECPDGSLDLPIAVGLEVDATNSGQASVALSSASVTLIIVASPAVPGEVGFASSAATTASPFVVPAGTTTVRLQTSLQCSNGSGDPPRFNEWSGRVVLATPEGAVNLETVDRLRVNIP